MTTSPSSISSQALKRLQGGQLILKGYSNEDLADIVDVSTSVVNQWRKKLAAHHNDIHVLVRKKGSGRASTLADGQKQPLKTIILAGAVAAGYPSERWTSKIVAEELEKLRMTNEILKLKLKRLKKEVNHDCRN